MIGVIAEPEKSGRFTVTPYARVTGGLVGRVQPVVRHHGHPARGVEATDMAFFVDLDERIGGCVLGRMAGRGEHGRGHLPRGGVVSARLGEKRKMNLEELYGLYHLLRQLFALTRTC